MQECVSRHLECYRRVARRAIWDVTLQVSHGRRVTIVSRQGRWEYLKAIYPLLSVNTLSATW
jgi:hypothetical protein